MLSLKAIFVQQDGWSGRWWDDHWYNVFQSSIWLLVFISLVVIGIFVYYAYFPRLSKVKTTKNLQNVVDNITEKKNVNYIQKQDKSNNESKYTQTDKQPIQVALRLLKYDEREILKILIEANGPVLQKNISKETGFSRVKTHRILVRLIQRGVIKSEKYYNTNKITLASWLTTKDN